MSPRAFLRLVSIAALLGLASPAWSLPGQPVDPNAVLPARFESIPTEVRAGEAIDLTWSGVPDDAEELELILSLDDGATYRFRVSPELDGRTRTWRWTAPNLAAERVRIRLRYGTEHGERDAALSPAFRIIADAQAPRARDAVREDRAEAPIEPHVPASSLRPSNEASLMSLHDQLLAEPTSSGSGFHRHATAAQRVDSPGPLPFRPMAIVLGAVAPTFVPMRN